MQGWDVWLTEQNVKINNKSQWFVLPRAYRVMPKEFDVKETVLFFFLFLLSKCKLQQVAEKSISDLSCAYIIIHYRYITICCTACMRASEKQYIYENVPQGDWVTRWTVIHPSSNHIVFREALFRQTVEGGKRWRKFGEMKKRKENSDVKIGGSLMESHLTHALCQSIHLTLNHIALFASYWAVACTI